ncbi:MAG: FmdE family protein [Anaerolineae bacterium]|nr:FmdE family protein [Anaerolineae bacterium]
MTEMLLSATKSPAANVAPALDALLPALAARHRRLCPRQVLGLRIALAAAAALKLPIPRQDKRLLVISETDGCFVSGLEVAAGVSVGRRTLRVVDYGKVAAVFVDVETGQAVRLAPHAQARQRAWDYAPGENRRYFAMLHAYQTMPAEALLTLTAVTLTRSLSELLGRPGVRAACAHCGEEIINQRQVTQAGQILCQPCAGGAYYREE